MEVWKDIVGYEGQYHSEKTKRAMSKSRLGRHLSEEAKQKMRDKVMSIETKKLISKSKIGNKNVVGYLWFNNGKKNVRSKVCPGDGWVRGRIKK